MHWKIVGVKESKTKKIIPTSLLLTNYGWEKTYSNHLLHVHYISTCGFSPASIPCFNKLQVLGRRYGLENVPNNKGLYYSNLHINVALSQ